MDNWHIQLYRKSILKQQKFRHLRELSGEYRTLDCLDFGSDNGIISYLLRENGGRWISADIDSEAVDLMRNLLRTNVYQVSESRIPFADERFDLIIIIDLLEHIKLDKEFIKEVNRVLKKNGVLVVHVPAKKIFSIIRLFRHSLGLTDEEHGHVREGYTFIELKELLSGYVIEKVKTYSRFFTELIDILISGGLSMFRRNKSSKKGILISQEDIRKHKRIFMIYSCIYPFMWLFSMLDLLLFFMPGYRMVIRARKE